MRTQPKYDELEIKVKQFNLPCASCSCKKASQVGHLSRYEAPHLMPTVRVFKQWEQPLKTSQARRAGQLVSSNIKRRKLTTTPRWFCAREGGTRVRDLAQKREENLLISSHHCGSSFTQLAGQENAQLSVAFTANKLKNLFFVLILLEIKVSVLR
jgi:hypothetical protein